MESRYQNLTTISSPQNAIVIPGDDNEPLSFKDWYKTHTGISSGQEYDTYNQYLINWYTEKKEIRASSYNTQLRLNYLQVLKQIQVFFNKEEKEKWYNFVNFNDEKEILLAIPYFAKKLKEVAIQYIDLRKKVKNAKLQYNLGGTNTNYVLELKNYLLDNFTKNENNKFRIPSWCYNAIPELSSINADLEIQIEEIYDDHEYLDQSPDLPVSVYYDLTDPSTTKFLKTKDLELLSNEWLYNNTVTFSGTHFDPDTSLDIANEYIVKYLGEDKNTSEVLPLTSQVDVFNVEFKAGDNYFLWPSSPYKSSVIPDKRYFSVPLTSVGFEQNGTGGNNIETSDTIFVRTNTTLQGAYLYNKTEEENAVTMEAFFRGNNKTSFLYPYPGFGLSGESFEWTGPSTKYQSDFYFLEEDIRKNIEELYWTQGIELTTTNLLKINNTTLVSAGAYPADIYQYSDKIDVWETPPFYKEPLYSDEIKKAWLYKFNRTSIPISPTENSIIVWPYERLDVSEQYPTYYPDNQFICSPVLLNSIKSPYSIAGLVFEEGDKIYKLKKYTDVQVDAIECAWLSGQYLNLNDTGSTVIQQSLLLNVEAGSFQRFIWQGPHLTDVNKVFKTVKHQPDCEYLINKLNFNDHSRCTCRNVLFSPLGHPGNTYFENDGYADIILQESDILLENTININNWKDRLGNTYKTSPHFMWYKSSSKIGWGDGKWVNELTTSTPQLQKNQRYIYIRVDTKTSRNSLPSYTLRHNYNDPNRSATWMAAKKVISNGVTNTWVGTNEQSFMTINQNDILLYERQGTTSYILSTIRFETATIAENRNNNLWVTYDYLTVADLNDPLSQLQQTVYVNYPNKNYVDKTTASSKIPGLPPVSYEDVVEIKGWTLKDPKGVITNYKTPSFTFIPLLTGDYFITVTVLSGKGPVYSFDNANNFVITPGAVTTHTFTGIPPVKAIAVQQPVNALTSVPCQAPGFVLETPLYGWDYSTNTQRAVKTPGARPFWAKSNTVRTGLNKFKGGASWGTPTRFYDTHNPVNQPVFSDIVFSYGQYIEYDRTHSKSFFWEQPLSIYIPVDVNVWYTLDIELSTPSTLSGVMTQMPLNIDLISVPTKNVSPITLTNVFRNEPVEVIYNAISPFTQTITVTAQINNTTFKDVSAHPIYNVARPWNHITNRFNPTVAHAPTLESIYTQKDTGGYFLPSGLGLSLYNSKDYTYTMNPSSVALSGIFEDSTKHIAGRGLTKQNNLSPYTNVKEDSTWLKDSLLTGKLAGNINRKLIKKYQKFIPYQPSSETNTKKYTGVLTPESNLVPWGGSQDKVWTDENNKPTSIAGEYNTNLWAESEFLKNTEKRIYNWVTDIYGNQYALYKDIKNISLYEQKFVPGTIWVRKNSQKIQPASMALKDVFDSYKNLSLHTELTGNGVLKIDIFFDTLYIETTGAVFFEKLLYDYTNDNIYSFVDSSHVLSLYTPVQPSLIREYNNTITVGTSTAQVGETWFLPEQKIVILSICELSGTNILPTLYEVDLAKETLVRTFPA